MSRNCGSRITSCGLSAPRMALLAVACIAALATATFCQTPATSPTNTDANVTMIRSTVKLTKEGFEKLTAQMIEVAQVIQKTDPESAKAIRDAVNKAQAAFVAKNMEEVYQLLTQSISQAHSVELDVQAALDEMLRILREGSQPKDRKEYMDWLKAMQQQVEKMIQQQKLLEEQTRQSSAAMQDMHKRLEGIVKEQQALLEASQKLGEGDKQVRRLDDLKTQLQDLLDKQEKLTAAAAQAGISERPAMAEAQKALSEKAQAAKEKLLEAAKDAEVVKALQDAGASKESLEASAKSTGLASEEMSKAADALAKSDAAKAGNPQKQAAADLKAAVASLEKALAQAAGKTPSGELSSKQAELEKKTKELTKDFADAVAKSGEDSDTKNLEAASKEMVQAARQLAGQDSKAAQKHQEEAIKQLQGQTAKLAQLQRKVEERPKQPAEDQKKQQDDITAQAKQALESMAKQEQKSNEKSPGEGSMKSAQGASSSASKSLSDGNNGQANQDQNKVLDELAKVREELAKAIDEEEKKNQDKTAADVDQMLTKILEEQRSISAKTKEIYPRRGDDGTYARKEVQELMTLSDGEGKLAGEVEKVLKMLKDENSTVVFPVLLQDVQEKLVDVKGRLAARQADELTQATQGEIEQTLESMLDAIRKRMAEAKGKGGGGKGGGRSPLVAPLAELKMVYLLQLQINNRTAMVGKQANDGKMPKETADAEHKKLSQKQSQAKDLADSINAKMQRQGDE